MESSSSGVWRLEGRTGRTGGKGRERAFYTLFFISKSRIQDLKVRNQ
jgi:hypothetical protein